MVGWLILVCCGVKTGKSVGVRDPLLPPKKKRKRRKKRKRKKDDNEAGEAGEAGEEGEEGEADEAEEADGTEEEEDEEDEENEENEEDEEEAEEAEEAEEEAGRRRFGLPDGGCTPTHGQMHAPAQRGHRRPGRRSTAASEIRGSSWPSLSSPRHAGRPDQGPTHTEREMGGGGCGENDGIHGSAKTRSPANEPAGATRAHAAESNHRVWVEARERRGWRGERGEGFAECKLKMHIWGLKGPSRGQHRTGSDFRKAAGVPMWWLGAMGGVYRAYWAMLRSGSPVGCGRCGAVWCGAVRCGAVRCGAVRCGVARVIGVLDCRCP